MDGSTKISNDKDADPTSADLARVVAWFDGMPVDLAETLLPNLVEGVRSLDLGAVRLRAENERLRAESAARATFVNGAAVAQARIIAERDELQGRLEAVRALCDDYEDPRYSGASPTWTMQHIRAALSAAPQPELTPWDQPLPAMTPEEFRREREGRWTLPEPPASNEPARTPESGR